jgi:hypothetical protein
MPRSTSSGVALSRLIAVATVPVPSGLVSTSTSPSWAPLLRQNRSGCTRPVTDSPNFTSASTTEWPPHSTAPASCVFSRPPASTSPSSSRSSSFGQPTMFITVSGRPPIANTSDSEFAAAMRPNQRGSSQIGGKKSSVCTSARSRSRRKMPASSKPRLPASRSGCSLVPSFWRTCPRLPGGSLAAQPELEA